METEGLRKYSLYHTNEPITLEPEDQKQFLELQEVREDLYRDKLVGLDDSGQGYGNLSIRLQQTKGQFLVSGSQTGGIEHTAQSDYSIVKDFHLGNFTLQSNGLLEPSSESLTHGAIYELFSRINSVIHIHSLELWTFMIESQSYPVSREVEYGTKEMVEEVRRLFRTDSEIQEGIFAMKGHTGGIVSFAMSPRKAYSLIESVNAKFRLVES